MLENYRAATSVEEIISIVKSTKSGEDTFLWVRADGQRKRFEIGDFEVDDSFLQFKFKIDRSALKYLTPMKSYHIKSDYDLSAFKIYISSIDDNVITCGIPEKILSLEKREKKRSRCQNSPESRVSLKIENELMKDSYQIFEFRITDYSVGGLGIILLENQMKAFAKVSGNIYLFKLKDTLLANPAKMEPIYFKKVYSKNRGIKKVFYRVGFMFDEDLELNTLSLFSATFS